MREGATEAPFSGKYVHTKEPGVYTCAACGNNLFSSESKFDSEEEANQYVHILAKKKLPKEQKI